MSAPVPARVAQILRLALASDQAVETIAAVNALRQLLRSQGLTHHDVAATLERGFADPPSEPPRRDVEPAPDSRDWRALAGA